MSYENLPTINRNVLVVVPTEGFLEWARKNPDDDVTLNLEELVADSTAYLIPEQDADADRWLKRNFKTIFEIELDRLQLFAKFHPSSLFLNEFHPA